MPEQNIIDELARKQILDALKQQNTQDPSGLQGALQKISALEYLGNDDLWHPVSNLNQNRIGGALEDLI